MPNIAEVLRAILSSAGQGVLHQRRQATRGGDYLERQEAADRAERSNTFARAKMSREFGAQDAQTGALAELAARSGIELTGDPEKDAALFQAIQEAEKSGLSRRFTESQIKANESLVEQRANMPDEKAADRALRERLAAESGDLRKLLATMAGNRPQIVIVPQTDGSLARVDKKSGRNLGVVGARPVPAGEQRKRAEGVANVGVLEQLDRIPDKFLGPRTQIAAGVRGGMVGEVLGLDEMPSEFTNAQAAVGHFRDQLVHALTGAAASVPEMRRLMTHIPDMKQRPNQFRSNVQISLAGLKIAEAVNAGELDPAQAGAEIARLIGSVGDRSGAPTGPGQPTGGGRDKLDDVLDSIGLGGGR